MATFSFYGFYWDYKAHREVFDQFELQREWRHDGVVWYIMGFLLPVLRFVYYYHFASNLEYILGRMDRRRRISAGGVLALMIVATSVLVVFGLVGLILVGSAIDPFSEEVVAPERLAAGVALAAVGVAAWVVLKASAYWRLQGALNRIWSAYAWRMDRLRASAAPSMAGPHGPPPGVPPMTASGEATWQGGGP